MIREIDRIITSRIGVAEVLSVYDEWKTRGLLDQTYEYIRRLQPEVVGPIIHSFTTHVHKEKGMFVDILGDDLGINRKIRNCLAVSADMLWAISLMFDDIEDEDKTRGGLESCWKKFGKEQTLNAALVGTKTLMKYLAEQIGDGVVVESGTRYIQIGLRSLEEHKQMNLKTPPGVLARNYEERCDFHSTFPLAVMAQYSQVNMGTFNLAISGLRLFNQGGQLINDLKDFVGGDMYGRSYSDIRRGVPTIPLLYMYKALSSKDRNNMLVLYGKGFVAPEERSIIDDLVEKSGVVSSTFSRIFDCYKRSLNILTNVLKPESVDWFRRWADYKQFYLKNQMKEDV